VIRNVGTTFCAERRPAGERFSSHHERGCWLVVIRERPVPNGAGGKAAFARNRWRNPSRVVENPGGAYTRGGRGMGKQGKAGRCVPRAGIRNKLHVPRPGVCVSAMQQTFLADANRVFAGNDLGDKNVEAFGTGPDHPLFGFSKGARE